MGGGYAQRGARFSFCTHIEVAFVRLPIEEGMEPTRLFCTRELSGQVDQLSV